MVNDPTTLIAQINESNSSTPHDYTFPTAGSFSPTAGRVLILVIAAFGTSLRDVDSLTTTIAGLSFDLIRQRTFRTIAAPTGRIKVYRGVVPASPGSGTLTVSWNGAVSQTACFLLELPAEVDATGSNGANAIAQSVDNAGDTVTSLTCTLGALGAANNALLGIWCADDNVDLTPGDSDEQVAEVIAAADAIVVTVTWRNSHGSDTTMSVSGTSEDYGGIALEIVEAAAGGEISGTSTAALTVGGSATATLDLAAESTKALTVGGSVTATLDLVATSTKALTVGGSITGELPLVAESTRSLAIGGSVTAVLDIVATSTQSLTIGGTVTGSVGDSLSAESTRQLTIGATTTAVVEIAAASTKALSVGGTATGTLDLAGQSVAALVFGGMAAAELLIQGASTVGLSIGGSVTAIQGVQRDRELFGALHTQPKLSGSTHTQSRLMGDPRTGPRYSGDPH